MRVGELPARDFYDVILGMQVEFHTRDGEVVKAQNAMIARYRDEVAQSTMVHDEVGYDPFSDDGRNQSLGAIG